MRQLDLFGSFVETPLAEKKQEEKQRALKKSEEISSVAETEEITYSLVQLAEETLRAETSKEPDESILIRNADKKLSEQPEQEPNVSFASADISAENLSAAITIEQPSTEAELILGFEIEDRKTIVDIEQKVIDIPEPQRNGRVIFEDGKITVKVKAKHIVL